MNGEALFEVSDGKRQREAMEARSVNKYQKVVLIGLLLGAVVIHGGRWVWAGRQHMAWQAQQEVLANELTGRTSNSESSDAADSEPPEKRGAHVSEENVSQSLVECHLVHVNTADVVELQTLPGIGPSYAQNIVEERQRQPFRYIEDLLRVRGIGPVRLDAIRPLICLVDHEEHDPE